MRPNKCVPSGCTSVLWLLVINQAVFAAEAALRTYFVEDLCVAGRAKINLRYVNSGILTSFGHAQDGFEECEIVFNPEHDSSVVLSLYRYNLEPLDKLIIENGRGFKLGLIGNGDFPDEGKSFQADGVMKLQYSRSNSSLINRSGLKFQFTFTQVHGGSCQTDEFQCRNRNCIKRKLVCDRHNHCGDNSDQEDCYVPKKDDDTSSKEPKTETITAYKRNETSRVWVIVIVSLGAALGVILIVCFGVFLHGLIKKERKAAKARSDALPTVAQSVSADASHPANPRPSVFTRVRESFRRPAAKTPQETATAAPEGGPKQDTYEVPSMYPHIPTAPHYPGIANPDFKEDE